MKEEILGMEMWLDLKYASLHFWGETKPNCSQCKFSGKPFSKLQFEDFAFTKKAFQGNNNFKTISSIIQWCRIQRQRQRQRHGGIFTGLRDTKNYILTDQTRVSSSLSLTFPKRKSIKAMTAWKNGRGRRLMKCRTCPQNVHALVNSKLPHNLKSTSIFCTF